ncbi:MAG: shikimate kinase [Planctomycetota bacterium]
MSTAPPKSALSTDEIVRLAASRPIVLVGLRGVGKSSVGRRLAAHVGRRFLDLDERLLRTAREAGHPAESIAVLYELVGPSRFRDLEAVALRQVLEPGILCVLATGGGAVERVDSRTWLLRAGFCVWLTEELPVIAERVRRDGAKRPALLGEDPVDELPALLRRREPLYRAVEHLVVAGAGRGVDEIAREIVERCGLAPAE